ncbi:3-phenylpropionate MFS transporter [Vibrio caribbeanicus]|uniref:3-phenylpropionate MFS transporter n=1 Tax=Vibrio caribbeanicus TaxID=701175 RepID=UPI002283E68E|nr:3-phenylpropionate MFS transporter [Vibrio caribbeanicus]MCY9844216.1 3-phenylpropionate MFS transporter [Vibrio caribbeanicus]
MLTPTPFGWVSQYFFGFFFVYGVYLPFWSMWFSGQGVSASDIGLLIGIGFATRCIANLVLTPLVHRIQHVIPVLRWLSLAGIIFIIIHLATGGSFWLLAVVTVLVNLCFGPIVPLSDALANYYASIKKLDYGFSRLWGSIAFIAGSTIAGFLSAHYGQSMIVWTALVGMTVTLIFSLRNIEPMPVISPEKEQHRPSLVALLSVPSVVRFLALTALIQGSHAAYFGFSSIHWKEAGYTEDVIGYLWSLGVVAEVVVFALSRRLFSGWSLRALFILASLGVIVRWGLTASTTDLSALVVIQLLHGVTFAVAHIAAIQYIQHAGQHQMVALQALYNAIPMGAVIAVMTAVSGWGYESWGASVFWLMAVMGVLSLFVKVRPIMSSVKEVSS